MPWTDHKLNNGHSIPGIGFGSSGHPLEKTADDINLAIECGFDHIDTAQRMSQSNLQSSSSSMRYLDVMYELTGQSTRTRSK